MTKIQQLLKKKCGTTLVEMIVTLLLISIMLAMATASLSSASKTFVRVQKMQYAQSILDTAMTELRTITKNATDYVKIYQNGSVIAESTGNSSGNALEFVNEDGYVILLTTDGCDTTQLYGENAGTDSTNTAEAVEKGQLLTRYYKQGEDKTYEYSKGTTPIARAVATAFGKGFYMGNYIEVTYSCSGPATITDGQIVNSLIATVALYSDEEHQNKIAEDTEVLEFRYKVEYRSSVTAKAAATTTE